MQTFRGAKVAAPLRRVHAFGPGLSVLEAMMMSMTVQTIATISETAENVWVVASLSGTTLITLEGVEKAVLGPATASLMADHKYPLGLWAPRGAGRYSYIVDENLRTDHLRP